MREFIVRYDNNKFTVEGEIVRCKDCKWFDVNKANFVEGYGYCERYEVTDKDSHYCSYGERKEKDQLSKETSTNNTVSKGVFDQVKWERDVALQTLEEHGIGFAERATTSKTETVEQTLKDLKKPNKNCEVADDDIISRQAAIEEIKNATTITWWNKYASQEEIVDDVERQLRRLFVGAIESLPPVEPERSRRTETMMVDGEPTEIDPLSYEVGYSHGQSERPKGEWIDEGTNYLCSECHRGCWVNSDYCPWCGADMRGDKE